MLVHQWTSLVDVSGLGSCQPGFLAEAGGWCNYRAGKAYHDNVLALVYICTFGEAWLRARFVTRSRVACWMLRCRERRNMATPSAIDLLIRSSRARKAWSTTEVVQMHCSINTYWGLDGQTGSPSFCLRGQTRQSATKIRCML
jgi:hypothetical protein